MRQRYAGCLLYLMTLIQNIETYDFIYPWSPKVITGTSSSITHLNICCIWRGLDNKTNHILFNSCKQARKQKKTRCVKVSHKRGNHSIQPILSQRFCLEQANNEWPCNTTVKRCPSTNNTTFWSSAHRWTPEKTQHWAQVRRVFSSLWSNLQPCMLCSVASLNRVLTLCRCLAAVSCLWNYWLYTKEEYSKRCIKEARGFLFHGQVHGIGKCNSIQLLQLPGILDGGYYRIEIPQWQYPGVHIKTICY